MSTAANASSEIGEASLHKRTPISNLNGLRHTSWKAARKFQTGHKVSRVNEIRKLFAESCFLLLFLISASVLSQIFGGVLVCLLLCAERNSI
jgi:hypothetical protein